MTSAHEWSAVLNDLEERALRLRRALETGSEPSQTDWVAPTRLGPCPEELVARAQAVLGRQQQLLAQITPLVNDNRQQRLLVDRVSGATAAPGAGPVYLDVTA